jgi:hypothetical protein
MTLEYLEIMEDVKNSARKKCIRSFKSNTRVFDDDSIEVIPQEKGTPLQKDVKKVGRSKRYATTGKNPLMCIELKCPDEVADKAAYFRRELAKLTRDIEISEPALPAGQFLVDDDRLKVRLVEGDKRQILAWLTIDIEGVLDVRKQLYQLTSEIEKCFAINDDIIIRARN